MRMNKCFFCKNYADKERILFENDSFYSRFDDFPVSAGHLLVIAKRHTDSILDLTKKEWEELLAVIKENLDIIEQTDLPKLYKGLLEKTVDSKAIPYLEKALRQADQNKNNEGFNIGVNEKEAAGQSIPHLHIHVIPRFLRDVNNPRGGVRNILDNIRSY